MRVQFALCGMNAHINRDLQSALVQTCEEMNVILRRDSPQHQDYEYVNNILDEIEPEAVKFLATGVVGLIDESLGDLDDILAMWSVRRARETAWSNAEIRWSFRNNAFLREQQAEIVDRLTSLAGRGLIVHL